MMQKRKTTSRVLGHNQSRAEPADLPTTRWDFTTGACTAAVSAGPPRCLAPPGRSQRDARDGRWAQDAARRRRRPEGCPSPARLCTLKRHLQHFGFDMSLSETIAPCFKLQFLFIWSLLYILLSVTQYYFGVSSGRIRISIKIREGNQIFSIYCTK